VEHDGSVEQGHGDLHNAIAAERADTGRFDVHDGPAAALSFRARFRGGVAMVSGRRSCG
jgi:hypothetical protein